MNTTSTKQKTTLKSLPDPGIEPGTSRVAGCSVKLMNGKALRKHSLHEKTALSATESTEHIS